MPGPPSQRRPERTWNCRASQQLNGESTFRKYGGRGTIEIALTSQVSKVNEEERALLVLLLSESGRPFLFASMPCWLPVLNQPVERADAAFGERVTQARFTRALERGPAASGRRLRRLRDGQPLADREAPRAAAGAWKQAAGVPTFIAQHI